MTETLDYEAWAIIRIECSDGIERCGMILHEEAYPHRIIQGQLHYEYLKAIIHEVARDNGLEMYDGENGDYDQIEY